MSQIEGRTALTGMAAWMDKVSNLLLHVNNKVKTLEEENRELKQRIQKLERQS